MALKRSLFTTACFYIVIITNLIFVYRLNYKTPPEIKRFFPPLETVPDIQIRHKFDMFWNQMKWNQNNRTIDVQKLIKTNIEEVFSELLNSMISRLDVPYPTTSSYYQFEQYESCAVVSNAYELLESDKGQHIDSNDLVIRINDAPVIGYERHVGERTDWRMVNNKIVEDVYKQDDHELQFQGEKLLSFSYCENLTESSMKCDERDGTRVKAAEVNAKHGRDIIYMLPPPVFKQVSDFIKDVRVVDEGGLYPTTGFIAILFALVHCRTVHAYGFIPIHFERHCHYYTEDPSCGFTNYHARLVEKLVLLSLAEQSKQLIYGHGILRLNRTG